MSANADSLVVEKITHYRMAQVIVLSPTTGPAIPLRGEAVVGQFKELEKKLKDSAEVPEPIMLGDKSCALATSLTIDAISGPVFWEEIVRSLPRAQGG